MKKTLVLPLLVIGFLTFSCSGPQTQAANDTKMQGQEGVVMKLDKDGFMKEIFNYEANPTKWVYEGNLPAIVDFYADWCAPCRLVAPIMDELAKEYKGKIRIYKVDTDKQKELAAVFQIRSIPSMLFIPMDGQPQMSMGALPKERYKEVIETFLLNKAASNK